MKRKSFQMLLLGCVLVTAFQTKLVSHADNVISANPATTENIAVTTEKTTEKSQVTSESTTGGTTETWIVFPDEETHKDGWNKKKTSYYKKGKKVKGLKLIDENLYLFNASGQLYIKSGLQTIQGKTYYFDNDHTLKTGVVKVDGIPFYFQKENGERIETPGIVKLDENYYCVKDD